MSKKQTKEDVQEVETVSAPEAGAQLDVGQEPVGPSLDITDLQTAVQIISICSARGAFKAEEMAQVGTLYNKLNSFVQAAADAAQDQAEA